MSVGLAALISAEDLDIFSEKKKRLFCFKKKKRLFSSSFKTNYVGIVCRRAFVLDILVYMDSLSPMALSPRVFARSFFFGNENTHTHI